MFKEEISAVSNAASKKLQLMENRPGAYFVLSMLAGMFVGVGILLIFTIGGLLSPGGFAGTKIVMGLSFSIALSLVVLAGSELFTGNNLVMTVGVLEKKVTLSGAIKLWIFCWIGNLAGSVLLAFLFYYAGLAAGDVGAFIAQTSAAKMSLPAGQLIFRGILCNFLVCLAVWCGFKLKSESGKLIMIFLCLFAFITAGFEHSIANMTLLAIGLLNPAGYALTIGGYFYNLLFVTLGNMLGGIALVAFPYAFAAGNRTSLDPVRNAAGQKSGQAGK